MDPIRCVLDLQGAQGESRFRGIGRYSLNLAKAMARTAGNHEVWIALSGLFPETAAFLRAEFDSLIPQNRIVTFSLPGPVAEFDPGNTWRRKVAERIREHFLAGLKPDIVHVSSMVEGYADDSVTSLSHTSSFAIATTFYDAIPFLYPKQYLFTPEITSYYLRKLQSIKSTDLLLAISSSSRREAMEALHIAEDRVVNISTGLEERFRQIEVCSEERASLLKKFGVRRPFLMYSGATDSRKNVEGLIAAFALLPPRLRNSHQILLVGKNGVPRQAELQDFARSHGLPEGSIVFTEFVEDSELLALYNSCALFVLPSFHEGFGLPALEAMACGAPTVTSNTTSLPEVVGREDALFDPHQPPDIAGKIERVLTDKNFSDSLRGHGLEQSKKFTWESTAKTAWSAFEETVQRKAVNFSFASVASEFNSKPRLAYFSPLPPERSGIADYSAELLPELGRFYDIDVVIEQNTVSDDWINANFPVRSAAWFERHSSNYQRVVYQMGNSPFHVYMFDILRRHPGVMVLHDLYQSAVLNWLSHTRGEPDEFLRAIFDSHGYLGLLQEREHGREWAVRNLPCSLALIRAAAGVIVHSQFARELADQCYGEGTAHDWRVVPQLRAQQPKDRKAARARLGIDDNQFLVCSFGFLAPTKLDEELISGWTASSLASREDCRLVFVGENEGGAYGQDITQRIQATGFSERITITGHCSPEQYRDYLSAADCAVQLRTNSRGETSRALLDCLSYGLPTIINNHGSFVEVPGTVAHKLRDSFSASELAEALDRMYLAAHYRQQVGKAASNIIREQHHPARVAEAYREAIEAFAVSHPISIEQRLLVDLASITGPSAGSHGDMIATARSISMNRRRQPRQLLLDVSATAKNDLRTGIERVARNLCLELIKDPRGWQVEPIRFLEGQRLYARKFGLSLVDSNLDMEDSVLEFGQGDVYVALDWCPEAVTADRSFFYDLRARNIPVYFLLHDLLPMSQPDKFPSWAVTQFREWLTGLCELADGIVCVSRSVADELVTWLDGAAPDRQRPILIAVSHSGVDTAVSASPPSVETGELPNEARMALEAMAQRPSLLMVGTLEPRKGHVQCLDAFEMLWAEGTQANLVILGREGWHMESLVARLSDHKELNRKLFWLNAADDRVLAECYRCASGLLVASEGEGFGLPLIEAAKYELPIVARDIPVFREIAGENAYFFEGKTAASLKEAVRSWLELYTAGRAPASTGMKWLTWAESAAQFLDCIVSGRFYREWRPWARRDEAVMAGRNR